MSSGAGSVAIVTGANRGIGLELVRRLAGEGFTTLLGSRDPDKGRSAAAQLAREGLSVEARQVDVLLPDDGPTGGFFRDGRRLDW